MMGVQSAAAKRLLADLRCHPGHDPDSGRWAACLDVVSNVGVHDVDHSELAVRVLEVAEELVVRVTREPEADLIHPSVRGGQRPRSARVDRVPDDLPAVGEDGEGT